MKIIPVILLIGLMTIIYIVRVYYVDYEETKERANSQVGEYVLDIDKTNLKEYIRDTLVLKNLRVIFKKDKTFQFNMDVPFLPDSIGQWKTAGNNEFNVMLFKNRENFEARFSACCSKDSTFSIFSVISKKGQVDLDEIYFKKINIKEILHD